MSLEKLRAFNTKESVAKREYLRADVLPIFATVEDLERVSEKNIDVLNELINTSDYIDYYGKKEEKEKINANFHPDNPYIISEVNNKTKYSSRYKDCQGIVVSGKGVGGEEISFIAHYSPYTFSNKEYFESFTQHLQSSIHKLQALTEQHTIDAVTMGGQYGKGEFAMSELDPDTEKRDEYVVIKEVVDDLVFQELGFRPLIAEGPNTTASPSTTNKDSEHYQSLLYDTPHRHLHILIRGATTNSGKSFSLDTIEEQRPELEQIAEREYKDIRSQHG